MKLKSSSDICIIGSGMVGLSLANQISERFPALSISILDKEPEIGRHTSGRNSGVLHAGIYYEPGTLKAKVCVNGAKRLKDWCKNEKLPIINCGKVITPQRTDLDGQLEVLLARGGANGAQVELIDEKQFYDLVPDGYTSTGRALWSPETSIVNPLLVINRLKDNLEKKGVKFYFFEKDWSLNEQENEIILSNKSSLQYDFVFNCAGLQSDRVAHKFGLGKQYTMLPFKGSYWQLKKNSPFKFDTNLYPVPDLEVPFLGVHVTPGFGGKVYLGPTATPALGRENYQGLRGIEPLGAIQFALHMTEQVFIDKKMRRYTFDQSLEWMPHKFIAAARSLIPKLSIEHIEKSPKIGIRPQLYDLKKKQLVQDFLVIEEGSSAHVINAISPAFTASFALADHILDTSIYFN
jgi:L-2-hydroxyglutarate oxidase